MAGTFQGERIVLVGGGIAASRACEALRAEGYGGAIVLLCGESQLPYDRPPLSKAALTEQTDTTFDVDYAALGVDVHSGVRATGLDPAGKVVHTTDGDQLYDALLIATGAEPILLPGSGAQLTLRTVADADRLRSRLRPGVRLALVGAGWINAEIATAALAAGCDVVCVEAGSAPLAKPLGAEVGERVLSWWSGVDLRLETGVAEVTATGLRLADGTHLDADVVVTGIGVRPATGWLRDSGIELDGANGAVVVDEYLQTSVPDVYAVGDVTARWSPRYGTRLHGEHWDDARTAPAAAAATLLGGEREAAVFDPVPYFWSDQFGHKLQFVGCRSASDEAVFREGENGKWGVAWVDAEGRLTAHLTVDSPRHMVAARMAIDQNTVVDKDAIRDLAARLRQPVLAPN